MAKHTAFGLILCAICLCFAFAVANETLPQTSQQTSQLYMQATPYYKNYIYVSGTILCENECVGATKLIILPVFSTSDIITLTSFHQFVIKNQHNEVLYEQSKDKPFTFEHNQLRADLTTQPPTTKTTMLLFEGLLHVTNVTFLPEKPIWFEEVHFVISTQQLINDTPQTISVYRTVTVSFFENLTTQTQTPFTTKLALEPIRTINLSATQPQHALFTSTWSHFPFDLAPSPTNTPINFILYEIVGPFTFSLNPMISDTISFDCTVNHVDTHARLLTPSTLLLYIATEGHRSSILPSDPLSIQCAQYVVRSTASAENEEKTNTFLFNQVHFSMYFFDLPNDVVDSSAFVQKNAVYAQVADFSAEQGFEDGLSFIFKETQFIPYSLDMFTIVEDNLTLSTGILQYSDGYNLPFNPVNPTFAELTDDAITLNYVNHKPAGPIYAYFNRIHYAPDESINTIHTDINATPTNNNNNNGDDDIWSDTPWSTQFELPSSSTSASVSLNLAKLLQKTTIRSFYFESFAALEQSKPNQSQPPLSATSPMPSVSRSEYDPYTIASYQVTTQPIESIIAASIPKFAITQASNQNTLRFNPLAESIEIVQFAPNFEAILNNVKFDANIIEIFSPRDEMTKFYGQLLCSLYLIKEGEKKAQDDQSGENVAFQGEKALFTNFYAIAGQYRDQSKETKLVDTTFIHFAFFTEKEAETEQIQLQTQEDPKPPSTPWYFTIGNSYRLQCIQDSTTLAVDENTTADNRRGVHFIHSDIKYTIHSDVMTFRGAKSNDIIPNTVNTLPEPTTTVPTCTTSATTTNPTFPSHLAHLAHHKYQSTDLVSKLGNPAVYRQTSAIFTLQTTKSSSSGLFLFLLFTILIALSVFFCWFSHRQPQQSREEIPVMESLPDNDYGHNVDDFADVGGSDRRYYPPSVSRNDDGV